jgi:cytochrome c-type biogenesis protein CcmH
MLMFVVLAALMLAAALAFLLPTLLGARAAAADPALDARRKLKALDQARSEGILSDAEYAAKRSALGEQMLGALDKAPPPSRTGFYAALGVALLLPACAIVLYRIVGEPRAISTPAATVATKATAQQAPADHEENMDQAIAGLVAKLKQNPEDAEGWSLLGRAYEATERFTEARDALKRAHELSKDDPDITVAYAEALALSTETRRIEGEPRALIETALKSAPQNQRGLWLLGISDYQVKKYDAAIATWKRLLAALPKDSNIAQSVQHQIASAEAARDGRAPPEEEDAAAASEAATTPAAPPAASADGPQLTVKVSLDAKLKGKLAPDDVLFVYAKAASGPPMPIAIQRLQASQLPVTVTLTDGMGMMPSMKLSQFPQVIIGARVSKSGNAIAQSGDLQTISKPMANTSATPIELNIDQVVP